jgi:hypothetical protein
VNRVFPLAVALMLATALVVVPTCALRVMDPQPSPEELFWRGREDELRYALQRAEAAGDVEAVGRLRRALSVAATEHRRVVLPSIPESQQTITPEGWDAPGRDVGAGAEQIADECAA